MPENLKFDEARGCTVTYTIADCEIIAGTNELVLTNVFTERTPGGTTLKFIISMADNPIGARYAGDWGARTESLFDGVYYVVDGNSVGRSFDAKAGFLKSTLSYTESVTFTENADLIFTYETEHDIPLNGFLKITLPVEMAFPTSIIESEDPSSALGPTATNSDDEQIDFVELTSQSILLNFPDGHSINSNPIELTLKNIRTPRSFRPSSEFII